MARRCQYWALTKMTRSTSSTISRRQPARDRVQHRQQNVRLRRRPRYNHSSEIFTNPIQPDSGRIVSGTSQSRPNFHRYHSRNQFSSGGNDTASIHRNDRSVANHPPIEELPPRPLPMVASRQALIVENIQPPINRNRQSFDRSRRNQNLIFYSETSCCGRLDHQRHLPLPFYSMDDRNTANIRADRVTHTPL